MKIFGHGRGPLHRHRLLKQRIDATYPGRFRAHCRGLEMRNLRQRMHAGIGAPCRSQSNGLSRDARKRALQLILYGIAGRL